MGMYRIWYRDGSTEVKYLEESEGDLEKTFNESKVLAIEESIHEGVDKRNSIVLILGLQDKVIKNVKIKFGNGVVVHEDISINGAVVRQLTDTDLNIESIEFPIECYQGAYELLLNDCYDRQNEIDRRLEIEQSGRLGLVNSIMTTTDE
ncbi:hypothetical protein [Enterobacter hormaechei]|uniref:hypothetical protein n=1 Tax=Enterobacter hormaechei TaxID=158836 RepID=UPI0030764786